MRHKSLTIGIAFILLLAVVILSQRKSVPLEGQAEGQTTGGSACHSCGGACALPGTWAVQGVARCTGRLEVGEDTVALDYVQYSGCEWKQPLNTVCAVRWEMQAGGDPATIAALRITDGEVENS